MDYLVNVWINSITYIINGVRLRKIMRAMRRILPTNAFLGPIVYSIIISNPVFSFLQKIFSLTLTFSCFNQKNGLCMTLFLSALFKAVRATQDLVSQLSALVPRIIETRC